MQSPRQKRYSEIQLHDNRLEVNLAQNTPFSMFKEIAHHKTLSHYGMYVESFVPTDPQIFVMHKINAEVFLVVNMHNY